MTLTQLLTAHRHVLLDFDGPVCAVFGGVSARDTATQFAAILRDRGVPLPAEASNTDDPFDVLRAATHAHADAALLAEASLRDLEVQAVHVAPLTPGIGGALDALVETGHTITIVSNNSEAAVAAVLAAHSLRARIGAIIARTEPDPALLKPNPHLVRCAIQRLPANPDECVLIGDSVTDITAARRAGTAVIAYANKPGKRQNFAPHRPDAIIEHMQAITHALRSAPGPHDAAAHVIALRGRRPRIKDRGKGRSGPCPATPVPQGSTASAPTSTRKNVC